MKYNFVIIHGIGDDVTGYSHKFQKNILRYWDTNKEIEFFEFLWGNEIEEGEKNLIKQVPDKFLTLRKWFVIHVSDIIAYLRNKELSEKINQNLREILNKILNVSNNINIVVAHSFGSVIAYDVLCGYQKHGLQIDYFFSLGSPLAIFVNDFKKENGFFKPLKVKRHWYNIYDPNDLIAFPLGNLDENWKSANISDKKFNFRNFFENLIPYPYHSDYLEEKKLAKLIVSFINEPLEYI